MKIRLLSLLSLTSAFSLLPSALVPAAPLGTAFTYQGRLNEGANPASGLYDLRFTIYDSSGGPTIVAGPLTNSPAGVTNGLFTVTLDFGASVFTGAARWLEIGVRTNGGGGFVALVPRQALTPAPYALYAPNAGAADSAGTATTATTATTAGTATTASIATLANSVANNAVTAAGIQVGQVVKSLNGLTDQVLLSAGTNVLLRTNGNTLAVSAGPWLPSNATNTWFTGGRVGIGRAPLFGALEILGGTTNAEGASVHIGGGAGGDPKLIHFGDMQDNGLGYVYLGENGQDDTMELRAGRFYFNSGAVGIFKTNPVTALDVNGTAAALTFSGSGAGLTNLNAANLNSGTVTDTRLSANVALLNNSQTFTGQKNFSQTVGIGTASPADALLDVEGDLRLNMHELYLREESDRNHGLGWYGAGKLFGGYNVDGPVLYGFDGGGLGALNGGQTMALHWNYTGEVNIDPNNLNSGAVTPGLTFGWGSGEGIASKRSTGGNQYGLDFYTSFTNRMTITQDGNVGIGTIDPLAQVHVSRRGISTTMPSLWLNDDYAYNSVRLRFSSQSDTSAYWEIITKKDFWHVRSARISQSLLRLGTIWKAGGSYDPSITLGGNTEVEGTVTAIAFNPSSDRNLKQNFKPVDAQAVLEKVTALPVSEWNFKSDATTPHIGPMAQDFHAAFGVGTDDKHIATVDADGVALAAIQGLNAKVEVGMQNAEVKSQHWEKKLQQKETEISELRQELAELKALVQTLAAKVNGGGK